MFTWFKVQKHIIFHILYIIVDPLCPTFLKRVDFYKAHRSEKLCVLWLASYPVCCDWPNTSSVWQKCYTLYHIWKHTTSLQLGSGDNNTTARIKVTPSFFAYTFVRCYANLSTPWHRHEGAFELGVLGGRHNMLLRLLFFFTIIILILGKL